MSPSWSSFVLFLFSLKYLYTLLITKVNSLWLISESISSADIIFSMLFNLLLDTQEIINKSHHMENGWVFLSIFRSTGKYNKTTQRIGEPGKLVLILSHSIGAFFPMRFSSYCILPHMGNGLASSSISHSIGKCSKSKKWRKSGKLLPIPFS